MRTYRTWIHPKLDCFLLLFFVCCIELHSKILLIRCSHVHIINAISNKKFFHILNVVTAFPIIPMSEMGRGSHRKNSKSVGLLHRWSKGIRAKSRYYSNFDLCSWRSSSSSSSSSSNRNERKVNWSSSIFKCLRWVYANETSYSVFLSRLFIPLVTILDNFLLLFIFNLKSNSLTHS